MNLDNSVVITTTRLWYVLTLNELHTNALLFSMNEYSAFVILDVLHQSKQPLVASPCSFLPSSFSS